VSGEAELEELLGRLGPGGGGRGPGEMIVDKASSSVDHRALAEGPAGTIASHCTHDA